ncbi:MAG: hypothetical protein WEF50_17860 [Myxococcota bacterium]
MLHLAARYADGWNAAYVSPVEFKRLSGVLDDWCAKARRDQKSITRTVNLSFHLTRDAALAEGVEQDLRAAWPDRRAHALRLARRHARSHGGAAGAVRRRRRERHQVALRASWDAEALDAYVDEVVRKARAQSG